MGEGRVAWQSRCMPQVAPDADGHTRSKAAVTGGQCTGGAAISGNNHDCEDRCAAPSGRFGGGGPRRPKNYQDAKIHGRHGKWGSGPVPRTTDIQAVQLTKTVW